MIQLAGVLVGAVLAAGGLVVPTAATDQATADAAVDAFTQRMLAAGFVAQPEDDDDAGDDTDDASDDIEVDASDDALDECMREAGTEMSGDLDGPMPGATAEAESPELEFAPDEETPSTDDFDLSLAIPESIGAFVTTGDESSADLMAQLVDWMGSKAAGDCFRQAFVDDLDGTDDDLGGTDDDDDDDDDDDGGGFDFPPPEIEVSNRPDIGVGDRSARLDMSLSMVFLFPIEMDISLLVAQSGRSMAMVMHMTGADGATSGVDPVAELQAIIDDLAA